MSLQHKESEATVTSPALTAQHRSFGVDPAVARDHSTALRTRRNGLEALISTALRTRSYDCRHVLAAGIDPSIPLDELVADIRKPGPSVDPDTSDAALWMCGLARVMALQSLAPTDTSDAVALYRAARQIAPYGTWRTRDVLVFAQLLLTTGELDANTEGGLVDHMDPLERRFLLADLESRRSGGAGGEQWLAHVNEALASFDVSPVTVHESAVPFDGLVPLTELPKIDGPLISVVMPAYRPGSDIVTAVRSILQQTWRNFELVVVDDCSGAEFADTFAALEDMDPRVTVLHLPVNRGTYAARNLALTAARGEFITFQDVDDWSHPERLARQVGPLLTDADLQRTLSEAIRARGDLAFERVGYASYGANASSHMFRRSVLEKVERFDWVRKSADSEFDRRLEAVFPGARLILELPLAFIRVEPESLSRSDFAPGWMHPYRFEYRQSMYHWHDQIAGGASAVMPPDVNDRPVTAPAAFLRDTGYTARPPRFDVVFAGDWRQFGGPQRSMIEEINALATTDLRIGVLQMEALRFATSRRQPMCAPVRDLIADGIVEPVFFDDAATIDLLVIRYPPVLEFLSSRPHSLTVSTVIIVANQVPIESDGTDRRYTVADCDAHARALFGTDPYWLPQGPLVRATIEAECAPDRLLPFDNPGIIDVDSWATPRTRLRSDRPVIGRLSRDAPMKWPSDPDKLLEAYPATPDFDVRVMGGRRSVTSVLGEVPQEWLVFDVNEVPARNFLNQIDFFVYFHHPVLQEAFGRAILEALAAGCVAVLPPHFKPVFEDAALYCDSSEVQSLVHEYHSNPELYFEQSLRGQNAARDQYGYEHFRKLVKELGALTPRATPV
ncbi:MAG: glycosyltransferase [Agromyces sp.]